MMVPKPEPNLPTPIEDEVRPPQVTVESSSSESEDEDRSDYPEGYIPITQYFDVQVVYIFRVFCVSFQH